MGLLSPELAGRLERLVICARRRARSGAGVRHLSTRQGRSPEFSDYRAYREGDDPRFLDWNLFQRLRKPFLKLHLKEEDLHLQFLLDTSASMLAKFRRLQEFAAALGYVALCGGDRVELITPDPLAGRPIFHGKKDIPRLLAVLEGLTCGGAASPQELAERAKARRMRGWGVRVMLSDFWGEHDPKKLLAALAQGGHEVAILQLISQYEVTPKMAGRVLLQDAETGESLACTAQELIPAYHAVRSQRQSGLENACRTLGCAYGFLTDKQPLEASVIDSLQKMGLLR